MLITYVYRFHTLEQKLLDSEPSNRVAELCIYTKKLGFPKRYKHLFPAPECLAWAKEGEPESPQSPGDWYYPVTNPKAVALYSTLDNLLQKHAGVKSCRPFLQDRKLRSFRQHDTRLFPAMWADEQELFMKTLANFQPKIYLEWGAGGSSRWLASLARQKVYSVDNYAPWCQLVRQDKFVKCLIEKEVFETKCILPEGITMSNFEEKLGERLAYAGSKIANNTEGRRMAQEYVDAIDSLGQKRFDAVLIDGRLRLACALKALNFVDKNSVVMIHDFWSRLDTYGNVTLYYDVIGQSRTAAVLRKKKDDELPEDWATAYQRYNIPEHQN